MKKILRNLSTPESRAWWESAERIAAMADSWPDSKRAGINVNPHRVSTGIHAGMSEDGQAHP
jgi:hypothetical protein